MDTKSLNHFTDAFETLAQQTRQLEQAVKGAAFRKALRKASVSDCEKAARILARLEHQISSMLGSLQQPAFDALAEMDSKDIGKPSYRDAYIPTCSGCGCMGSCGCDGEGVKRG